MKPQHIINPRDQFLILSSLPDSSKFEPFQTKEYLSHQFLGPINPTEPLHNEDLSQYPLFLSSNMSNHKSRYSPLKSGP